MFCIILFDLIKSRNFGSPRRKKSKVINIFTKIAPLRARMQQN